MANQILKVIDRIKGGTSRSTAQGIASQNQSSMSNECPPTFVSLDELLKKSAEFNATIKRFPCTNSLCKTFIERKGNSVRKELEENINGAYPIVHEKVVGLIDNFLEFKKKHGSDKEKAVYAEMDIRGFIDRLLLKRPLIFVNRSDNHLLRDGKSGSGGFVAVGTKREVAPLILEEYMSYDEMKISALLSTSSQSLFINNGDRFNKGVFAGRGKYEESGVIVGLIGARFDVENTMDWQDMVVTHSQNTKENGYGPDGKKDTLPPLWAKFYDQPNLPLYKYVNYLVEKEGKGAEFVRLYDGFFVTSVYNKRIRISAETFLIEANHRAAMAEKKAYVHMVGIGLGVWRFVRTDNTQAEVFMEAFRDCFTSLGPKLEHISDVHFSWFDVFSCGGTTDGQVFPGTNITLHFFNRCPQDRLVGEHSGKLSVSCWAWDSNSFPGNEYWSGNLCGSGDPAAASNSQIVELHNPYINPKISGMNLHVATREHGVLTLQEYYKTL